MRAPDENLGYSELKVVGEVSWLILLITVLHISQTMFANAVHRWILINLRGVRQVLIACFGDMNVVLNSHPTHFPIFIQHSFIDILAQC
jgi:hypothetical protein